MNYAHSDLQKIRWRCARRGMKEMDLLLTPFFDNVFLNLSPVEQHLFLFLLDQPDTVLWDWFFSDVDPKDAQMRQLLIKIKQHQSH